METKKKLSKKTKLVIGVVTILILVAVFIAVIAFGGNDKNDETKSEEESSKTEKENKSEDESEKEDDSEEQEKVVKHQYGIVYDDETNTYTCRWEAKYDINGELIKKTYYDPTGYRKIENHILDEFENTTTVTYEIVDEYDNVKETFDINPLWEKDYEDDNNVEVINTYYEEYELNGAKYEMIKMEPFGGEVILYNGEVYVDLSSILEEENEEIIDTLKMLYGDDVMDTLSTTIENCETYEIEGLGKINAIRVDASIKQVASNVGHDIDDRTKNGIILISKYYSEHFLPFDFLIKGSSEREHLNVISTEYFGVINYEHNGSTVSYLIEKGGKMTSVGSLTQSDKVGIAFDEEFLKTNMETVEVYRHKDDVFSKIQTIVYDENGNVKENTEFNPEEIASIPVIPKEKVKETEYDEYNRVIKELFESGNYVEYSYWGNYDYGSYGQGYYDSNGNLIVCIREEYYENKLRTKEIDMGYWEDYNIYVFEYSYFEEEENKKDYSVTELYLVNEAVLHNGEVYIDIYDENNIDYKYMEDLEVYVSGFFEEDGKDGKAMIQNMIKADENCSEYTLGELGKYKALKLDAKNVEKIYRCGWGQDINAETGIIMIHDDKTVSYAYSLDMTQGINSVIKLDITDVEDIFWYDFNGIERYLVKGNGEMVSVRDLVGSPIGD